MTGVGRRDGTFAREGAASLAYVPSRRASGGDLVISAHTASHTTRNGGALNWETPCHTTRNGGALNGEGRHLRRANRACVALFKLNPRRIVCVVPTVGSVRPCRNLDKIRHSLGSFGRLKHPPFGA
eukprot:CAMPEP_0174892704 /NCGR_PEP_ID=MMETSP0167-20121228/7625_1 /TAXON_ID=38298 /ORGANISM="Rhodella maculata, Strain CCMP736" /LENGTH=125 /DNA_ID=CAMNT_0016131287 /DNA_START=136 /DNA_END=513 /DNA_ORIENTATION=-